MTEKTIELAVEVNGTPDQVWRAIATGPGISSWYVPHVVEERTGGAASARFGPGPEMEVPGRVAVWEPPHRIVFDGGEGVGGLAFEWLVEERSADTCTVRLVNSGFGEGGEWDSQYEAMENGWKMFLSNLQTHLEHFGGQSATAGLPTGFTAADPDATWSGLLGALGVAPDVAVGDRVVLVGDADLRLAGTVADRLPQRRLTLVLDEPAPGTALIAVEPMGNQVSCSIWFYLYGPEGAAVVARDESRWQSWLDGQSGNAS